MRSLILLLTLFLSFLFLPITVKVTSDSQQDPTWCGVSFTQPWFPISKDGYNVVIVDYFGNVYINSSSFSKSSNPPNTGWKNAFLISNASNNDVIMGFNLTKSQIAGNIHEFFSFFQLREFDHNPDYDPDIRFVVPSAGILRIDSYTGGATSLGRGYAFINLPKWFIHNKKVSIRWRGYFSATVSRKIGELVLVNHSLNRKETSQYFVPNSNSDGLGQFGTMTLAEYYCDAGGWCDWKVDTTSTLDLSDWNDKVCLLVKLIDSWTGSKVQLDIDYIKVGDSTFGLNGVVEMEKTGTYNDYGYFLPENHESSFVVKTKEEDDTIAIFNKDIYAKGYIVYQGSQAGCPADGYSCSSDNNYIISEDNYCDVFSGSCKTTTTIVEDCSSIEDVCGFPTKCEEASLCTYPNDCFSATYDGYCCCGIEDPSKCPT